MRTRLPMALGAITWMVVSCGSTTSVVPAGEPLRIVSSQTTNVIGVGQTAKLTWTVVGTTEPVRLRLVNNNRGVARLSGGDVRVVTTSGGDPNTVSVTARGLQQGTFDVRAEFADPRERQMAETEPRDEVKSRNPRTHARIVAAFAPTLNRIADEIEKGANDLGVRAGRVRVNDVLEILDRAEDDLRRSLPQREMAPFRDAVAAFLDGIRRDIHAAASEARSGGGIMLIASAERKEIAEVTARSLLSVVRDFFRGNAGKEPLIEICIQTSPKSGATVTLSPKSFKATESVTSTSLMTLYVGLYTYTVSRSRMVNEGEVNLLTTPYRLVVLPLREDEDSPTAPQYKPLMGPCHD